MSPDLEPSTDSTVISVRALLNRMADTLERRDGITTAAARAKNQTRRINSVNGHFWRLRDMAQRGEIHPVDDRHLPAQLETNAFLTLDDARKYLDLAGLHSTLLRSAEGALPTPVRRGPELAEERQTRRFERLLALGGNRTRKPCGNWQSGGVRGALAALAREETEAERQYSDVRDVARDLDAEAERRRANRAMPGG